MGILKVEGHYRVLKASPFDHKGGFMSVLFHDSGMEVSRKPISKRVYLVSCHAIQHIYKWCREGIMQTGIILTFAGLHKYKLTHFSYSRQP